MVRYRSGSLKTLNRVLCNVELVATPVDLGGIIFIKQVTPRVTYRLEKQGTLGFRAVLEGIILKAKGDESFSWRMSQT